MAVPMSQKSGVGLPTVKSRAGGIGTVGGVGQGGANTPSGRPLPDTVTLTCTNATGAAVNYMLFDAFGAVAAAFPGTYGAPTGKGLGPAIINKQIAAGKVYVFSGFNYIINTGTSSQFSQNLFYAAAQTDGSSNKTPIDVEKNQRNTQLNTLIQTLDQQLIVDDLAALILTVEANTTVTLSFFVKDLIGGI